MCLFFLIKTLFLLIYQYDFHILIVYMKYLVEYFVSTGIAYFNKNKRIYLIYYKKNTLDSKITFNGPLRNFDKF
jgi:hypothetical protein